MKKDDVELYMGQLRRCNELENKLQIQNNQALMGYPLCYTCTNGICQSNKYVEVKDHIDKILSICKDSITIEGNTCFTNKLKDVYNIAKTCKEILNE